MLGSKEEEEEEDDANVTKNISASDVIIVARREPRLDAILTAGPSTYNFSEKGNAPGP